MISTGDISRTLTYKGVARRPTSNAVIDGRVPGSRTITMEELCMARAIDGEYFGRGLTPMDLYRLNELVVGYFRKMFRQN